MPLAEQATVEQECNAWAELWKTDGVYEGADISDIEAEPLELLSAWSIRKAAMTFPAGTGLGADNIAPRAVNRLSDRAIEALAVLYAALERLGSWPTVFNLVLIVLLPKPDGGMRPIGLFPTLIRLWMRSRLFLARSWEAAHSIPMYTAV